MVLPTKGHLNGQSILSSVDALIAMQIASGDITSANYTKFPALARWATSWNDVIMVGDVNCDGSITSEDASLIMKASKGSTTLQKTCMVSQGVTSCNSTLIVSDDGPYPGKTATAKITSITPSGELIPNGKQILLTCEWETVLNADKTTRARIELYDADGNLLGESTSEMTESLNASFTYELPLNIVDSDVIGGFAAYTIESSRSEKPEDLVTIKYLEKIYDIYMYIPAVLTLKQPDIPSTFVNQCTTIPIEYSVILNHDVAASLEVFVGIIQADSYNPLSKLSGTITSSLVVGIVGTNTITVELSTLKPDGTVTTLNKSGVTNVINKVSPVHNGCNVPFTSKLGSDVPITVNATGGNCDQPVEFTVSINETECVTAIATIPANSGATNYPIIIPAACLPSSATYAVGVTMFNTDSALLTTEVMSTYTDGRWRYSHIFENVETDKSDVFKAKSTGGKDINIKYKLDDGNWSYAVGSDAIDGISTVSIGNNRRAGTTDVKIYGRAADQQKSTPIRIELDYL